MLISMVPALKPGSSSDWSLGNPLHDDVALFEMYTAALGDVLSRPEIRDACDEFGLSVTSLRTRMSFDATRVFAAAPHEFEAYRRAVAQELATSGTGPAQVTHGASWDLDAMARAVPAAAFAIGAVMIVAGAATSVVWDPMTVLAQAGATVLVVSALLWAVRRFFGDGLFKELGFSQFGSRDLGVLRAQLIAAVRETELLAQVRLIINAARQDRFGHLYSVAGAPGLSEVYDNTNLVPTKVGEELYELLERFGGASIGVAGPRGSGKSTLVRQYCQGESAAD
ncbi:MAG TPA: hypothetical protein VKU39_20630, partial [Streptosporangiaceae bacterium]|nr:hypothetical protein [Streptosporangiaceae bacterium]